MFSLFEILLELCDAKFMAEDEEQLLRIYERNLGCFSSSYTGATE